MTDTSTPPSSATQRSSGGADPLEQLYKMSRTAGLGNDSYVAVNGFAVASMVFGLGSALVVMNAIFLIVPIIAIVLGIVALYQVRHSNDTQTGRGLSWIGILLAIGFSGLLGTTQVRRILSTEKEEQGVADLIAAFGTDVAAKNYDAAYGRFDSKFTDWQSKEKFIARMQLVQATFGNVRGMKWNGRAAFEIDGATGEPRGLSVAVIDFDNTGNGDNSAMGREEMQFVKHGQTWKIMNIPKYFPPDVVEKDVGGAKSKR